MAEYHYVYRDSVTGELVTEEYAKANPETTQRERVQLLNESNEEEK